ncbi:MAG: DUF1656 domain-containing protein [Coxiellaceae bacterium]|nr:DUF1656 domain-containing protein [Coxiellaceae bacterium]
MNYDQFPKEISISGIYFPPLLMATILGILLAWLITRVLNYFGLARYVWHPPLFYLALIVICTGLIGIFVIPI